MLKKTILGLMTLAFVCSSFMLFSVVRSEGVYAKPPDWAPAHGYRRKHGEEGGKHWDNKDTPYYWTFMRIDANDDGRISLQEWDGAKAIFVVLDTNHDGYLSPTEYGRIDEERGLLGGLVATVKEKALGFWNWLF